MLPETAVIAVNLAVSKFIKKVAHEATMYSLQEAKKNSQSKLPLHVEYEHLAGMFEEKMVESKKNQKDQNQKDKDTGNKKGKGKSKKVEEGNHFCKTMTNLFPKPMSLDDLLKDKHVQIANMPK